MERDKFMQYGRGLGLWQNPRENIKPEPINYFRDDPIYITPSKGEWVNQVQECKKENNPLENGVFIWTEIKGTGHTFVSVHEGILPMAVLVDGLVLSGLSVMAS